ncbi:MAG: DUF58 domain-containing protein [Nitrospirae bacterium]|nr:DUF58 domain-containing protein [Nitrospirota bacterium]
MKLTREGKRFLLAAALIAVAAVNTGNNLIYLILSLMLSFLLLSYLILRLNLAGLLLEVSLAGPVFAEEEVCVDLLVHNGKKIPAYSVLFSAPEAAEPVYCGQISGYKDFRAEVMMMFRKRGLYGYRDFVVQSGFPFILFRKSMSVHVSGQILVYPKLLDIKNIAEVIDASQEEGRVAVRGSGDEVYALRAFQNGDDWRRIHWKASARQDGFLIREYAAYTSQKITILLDNLLPQDAEQFETAVSVSASLAQHFNERGYPVRLIAGGVMLPFGSGKEHVLLILDTLALIAERQEDFPLSGFEADGFTIAVLKSAQSGLKSAAAFSDLVIHADTL